MSLTARLAKSLTLARGFLANKFVVPVPRLFSSISIGQKPPQPNTQCNGNGNGLGNGNGSLNPTLATMVGWPMMSGQLLGLAAGPLSTCVRYASGRVVCPKAKKRKCRKVRHKCIKRKRKGKKSYKKKKFKSMWETRTCCAPTCPDIYRSDIYHYKLIDKTKWKFPRTWWECNDLKMRKKRLCKQPVDMPPMPRRGRKPKTACKFIPDECPKKSSIRCPRINLKNCSNPNVQRCKKVRLPDDCQKLYVPCPAYSECNKDPPRPLRPVECNCLTSGSQCAAFAYLRKKGKR